MRYFVYSTVTTDIKLVDYQYVPDTNEQRERDSIVIKGGSNTINKRLITIRGAVITEIPEDKIGWVVSHPTFKAIEKNGYFVLQEGDRAQDGEKVSSDGMATRDGSAQAEHSDFGPGGRFHVPLPDRDGFHGEDSPIQRSLKR